MQGRRVFKSRNWHGANGVLLENVPNWMKKQEAVTVVLVNPYATKRAKELVDNSPMKSDKKDALTIAKLVKDGRYFDLYIPNDVYAELRTLATERTGLIKRIVSNFFRAVMH